MYFLYLLRSVPGFYLLEISINLSQYRRSEGVFNNINFFVQSKVSHFLYLSDSNSNNNYSLGIGPLILLNKIVLVLLLLNLMYIFKFNGSKHKNVIFIWTLFSAFVSCNFLRWLYVLLITLSGDIELNPGPKCNTGQTVSISHWNLNSICAHNFAKLSLLRAYVIVCKFIIKCLSETYLDYSINDETSMEWIDLGHISKGVKEKCFVHFYIPFLYIFQTWKIVNWDPLRRDPRSIHFILLFSIYTILGQLYKISQKSIWDNYVKFLKNWSGTTI